MKNIGAERQLSEYNHVYKENTAIYRDLSIRMGLTESTFWILYTLRVEESPVTQSDMCAILGYPKQTVNSAVTAFYKRGWIRMQELPEDRRNKTIHFTEQGRHEAACILQKVQESERAAMDRLSREEQDLLLSLTRRYVDACKNTMKGL